MRTFPSGIILADYLAGKGRVEMTGNFDDDIYRESPHSQKKDMLPRLNPAKLFPS